MASYTYDKTQHNIIEVFPNDPDSVTKAEKEVNDLFGISLQPVVVVEPFYDFTDQIKIVTEKFTKIGCPMADFIGNYSVRGFTPIFEEAKEKYHNIILIKR